MVYYSTNMPGKELPQEPNEPRNARPRISKAELAERAANEQKRINTQESLRLIEEESLSLTGFVDTSGFRDEFLETLGDVFRVPERVNPLLVEQQRRDNLATHYQDYFRDYFGIDDIRNFKAEDAEAILSSQRIRTLPRAALRTLFVLDNATRSGVPLRELRSFTGTFDEVANNPDDPIDVLLDEIFADDELRVAWVNTSRSVEVQITQANQSNADRAAKGLIGSVPTVERDGKEILKKRIAIVGSSFTATIIAKTLAPYVGDGDITVIDSGSVVGERWLGRDLIFNSTGQPILDLDKPRLPAVKGSETTASTPSKRTDVVRAGKLAKRNGLQQICDDGSTRQNPSGMDGGAEGHMNLTTVIGDYFIENTVIIDKTEVTPQQTTILTLRDAQGTERRVEFDYVFYATGAEQQSKVRGAQAKLEQSVRQVRQYIAETRQRIADGLPVFPNPLPRYINRQVRELLLYHWVYELGRNPDLYPFRSWYDSGKTIAIGGVNGDEFSVITEALIPNPQEQSQRGVAYRIDRRAIPDDTSDFETANIIGVGGRPGKLRRRYENTDLSAVIFSSDKAQEADDFTVTELDFDINGAFNGEIPRNKTKITDGKKTFYADYYYDATGLAPVSLTTELSRAGIQFDFDRDRTGTNLGRRSLSGYIYISGFTNRFEFIELPVEVQQLIAVINREVQKRRPGDGQAFNNTAALFVYSPLIEKQVWQALRRDINLERRQLVSRVNAAIIRSTPRNPTAA